MASKETILSKIWLEEAESDNPFQAKACYCAGYDVFGDVIGKASWIEYLYLLFKGEKPTEAQASAFEMLAIALANPGPRDLSVRAAMNGGVGGSLAASCLMAALGPAAGGYQGARELYLAMNLWQLSGTELNSWRKVKTDQGTQDSNLEVWPEIDHIPGFDPYGNHIGTTVIQLLEKLKEIESLGYTSWLFANRDELSQLIEAPVSMVGVSAAVFLDLGFSSEQGEMLYLLLRMPGAAAHALEQRQNGYKKYPFFRDGLNLTDDPGPVDQIEG